MHRLSREAARPLTDRECAKLINGLLGALLDTTDPEKVRSGLEWSLENFDDIAEVVAEGKAAYLRNARTTGSIQ